MARSFKGLGALFIGGLRVGIRVAMYVLTDMFGSSFAYVGDSSRILSSLYISKQASLAKGEQRKEWSEVKEGHI